MPKGLGTKLRSTSLTLRTLRFSSCTANEIKTRRLASSRFMRPLLVGLQPRFRLGERQVWFAGVSHRVLRALGRQVENLRWEPGAEQRIHGAFCDRSNQKYSCGTWRLMTRLLHERCVDKGLELSRQWLAFLVGLEWVWNAACHPRGKDKRASCGRLRFRAIPSATNSGAR